MDTLPVFWFRLYAHDELVEDDRYFSRILMTGLVGSLIRHAACLLSCAVRSVYICK